MRSRKNHCTISCREVHDRAAAVVQQHIGLEDCGYKCRASVLLSILFFAASRVGSIFAACRNIANAPTQQAVFNALVATLPEYHELQKRVNAALADGFPKSLRRRPQTLAIDLTLIPYHGQPQNDANEIYRSQPKSGTSHFHAYATCYVVRKGHRFTIALTPVQNGEPMEDVVKRLLRVARAEGVKCRLLLLDRGFYQRGGDSLLAGCPMCVLDAGDPARSKTCQRQTGYGHPCVGGVEEERLVGPHVEDNQSHEVREDGHGPDLRVVRQLRRQVGPARPTHVRVCVLGLSARQHPLDSRNVSNSVRDRNQLSPDERGPHSDMHQESPVASVLLRLGDDPAKRLGMVSSDNTFRTTRPTFDTAPGTAAIPRSSSQPSTGRRIRPRNHSIHGTATTTATTACDAVKPAGKNLGLLNLGEIVGQLDIYKTKGWISGPGNYHPYVWKNGEMIDLETQIDPNSGWERLWGAYQINDAGIIAGRGRSDVESRGFLLIPNNP